MYFAKRELGVSMNVGIIGCGGVAPAHIKAYQKIKGVKVVAVCDLNLERAKSLGARFGIKKVFDNYWDMFKACKLDLVSVCTPVSTHKQIVCDVATAVPAILVEKPMALSVSECDEMIKAVNKYGSKLCIGHNQIFSPLIQRAKALVDSGKFKLLSFRTTQKESFELLRAYNLAPAWNVSPEQKGIIWEVCCHLAYLQLHFLPDIKEVYAVGGKVRYPVYDAFAVLLRTNDERFGLIELSWISKETEIVYELSDIEGKRLQIHRDFNYFLENSITPPFNVIGVLKNILVDEKRVLQKWMSFGLSYIHKTKTFPTFQLINSYIECIKKDLPPPISPKDGRNNIKLLECIEKSLRERKPEKLNFRMHI
jgi:predicted dehydrogenase